MEEQIEIPLNKKKIVLHSIGALIFVILGLGFMVAAIMARNQMIGQLIFFIVGLASVLFFGLATVVLLPKIVSRKAGMIINDEGIIDNTSGVSAGFIAWSDIKKIGFSSTFLVVMVKKPQVYIDREPNFIKRKAMHMNYKISGTPIHILVSFLDINLYTLREMISSKRNRKKNTNP